MQGCPGNKRRAVKLFPLADKPLSTQALEKVDPFGETKLASTNSTDRPMAFALHCALCFSKLCFVGAEEQKEQFPLLAATFADLPDNNSSVAVKIPRPAHGGELAHPRVQSSVTLSHLINHS